MFQDKLKTFNLVFRALMHIATLTLFVSIFFFNSCEENIYPSNFLALVIVILIHQVYDCYLKS